MSSPVQKKCWYLSCGETSLHIIPGFGAITGIFKWGVTQIEIQQYLEPEKELLAVEKAALAINDFFLRICCASKEEEDVESVEQIENTLIFPRTYTLLSGKSANRGAMAITNFFVTTVAVGTVLGYTLWKTN